MNLKIVPIIVLVAMSVSLTCVNKGMASEEGVQSNGAIVKGLITFKGAIPPTETVSVRRDAKFCGQTIAHSPVVVESDTKGVVNVVVSVEGIASDTISRPSAKPIPLVNQNC